MESWLLSSQWNFFLHLRLMLSQNMIHPTCFQGRVVCIVQFLLIAFHSCIFYIYMQYTIHRHRIANSFVLFLYSLYIQKIIIIVRCLCVSVHVVLYSFSFFFSLYQWVEQFQYFNWTYCKRFFFRLLHKVSFVIHTHWIGRWCTRV